MMHKELSHLPENHSPDAAEQEAMTSATEYRRGACTISTDKARLDLNLIHDYLSRSSYWAQGRPLAVVQKSIAHSLCFGVYAGAQQVGFARVVTDYATFAWLCDLFVVESHRGQGLGRWLVERIVAHPELRDLHIFLLATRDAHQLYRRYGRFEALPQPDKWMARRPD
jgi:GNAT superfamily N-acetyltransferase